MEKQALHQTETARSDKEKLNPMLVTILKAKLLLRGITPSTLQGLSTDDPLIIEKYAEMLKVHEEEHQKQETLP